MKLFKLITVLLIISFSNVTYAGDGLWGENSFGSSNSTSSNSNAHNSISNNRFGTSNASSNEANSTITYKKENKGIKKILNKIFGIKFKSKTSKIKKGDLSHDPSSVPVDGELGLLLLGAAAFGYKKLRGKNKNIES